MEGERRNWAELPTDLLSIVFTKLGAVEILKSADAVCRPWRHLALHPRFYGTIILSCTLEDAIPMEKLARNAIDRSAGLTHVIFALHCGSEDLLSYIADRTTELKSLTMIQPRCLTGNGLANFLGRCPMLEKCEVMASVKEFLRGSIGRLCPQMKLFALVREESEMRVWLPKDIDAEALEIADTMPQLRKLRLSDNAITNKGLHTILDKCPHLEYLDLNCCNLLQVELDAGLQARLAKIKDVLL